MAPMKKNKLATYREGTKVKAHDMTPERMLKIYSPK
jgi:hypothetical protein